MDINYAICLECGKEFEQLFDLQLCGKCQNIYDTDRLWADHDNNKVDALDFNESKSFRDKYKLAVYSDIYLRTLKTGSKLI
jgi:hypothetical protein